MAHILYVHQYFKTPEEGGAIRSYHVAKALQEAGHQVSVLTAHNHAHAEEKEIDGIHVWYLPVFYENNLSASGRIISFIKFMLKCIRHARRIHRTSKIDLVLGTSTPLTIGIPCLWLKWFHRIPFIFEVRDLWPEAAIQMGFLKSKGIIFLLRRLERILYQQAVALVALSPGMKDGMQRWVPGKTIQLIPNLSDVDYFTYVKRIPSESIRILYAGALGKSNALEPFIGLLPKLQTLGVPLKLTVAGKGSEMQTLKKICQELPLNPVTFVGHLSKAAIRKELEAHDLVLIHFKELPILSTNSPNKFFDALAAGRPCLINVSGWIADILTSKEIGFYFKKEEPEALASWLLSVLQNPTMYQHMCDNARNLAETEFEKKRLCQQYVSLIQTTLNESYS
ncbi:MAG: glycosyltransferase family 4 protein [Cytophagaceae bacterium]|jgi:glycosyltransferase involved in cell wall biosynthesis|nr:glycosyltransferase family 4 protein [Cytophagaceae bacterium]